MPSAGTCHRRLSSWCDRRGRGRSPPFEMVDAVLEETCRVQRRVRVPPARVVVYPLPAGRLFDGLGYRQVWRRLAAGLGSLPPAAARDDPGGRRLGPCASCSSCCAARPRTRRDGGAPDRVRDRRHHHDGGRRRFARRGPGLSAPVLRSHLQDGQMPGSGRYEPVLVHRDGLVAGPGDDHVPAPARPMATEITLSVRRAPIAGAEFSTR
jgi:hypothetical protein